MPIVVSHQPNMNLLADASYRAGLGQYQQQQQEMQQRERMQIRALQTNLYSQAQAQEAALQRQLIGGEQDFRRQSLLMEEQQKFQREMQREKMQADNDQFRADMENRKTEAMLQRESIERRPIAKFYMNESSRIMKQIDDALAEGMVFDSSPAANEEAMRQWMGAKREIGIIQSEGTMFPFQQGETIYQKLVNQPVPSIRAKGFQDELNENMAEIPDPFNPELKRKIIRRGMAEDITPDPPKQEDPKPQSMKDLIFGVSAEAITNHMKLRAQAMKELTKKVPDGTGGFNEQPPTSADIDEWIQNYVDNEGKTTKGEQKQKPEGPVSAWPPPPPSNPLNGIPTDEEPLSWSYQTGPTPRGL